MGMIALVIDLRRNAAIEKETEMKNEPRKNRRYCPGCNGRINRATGFVNHEKNCPERARRNAATFGAFAAALHQ